MTTRRQEGLPELLAPAGDFARLKTALLYGADAVYGAYKEFGMRAAPQNFGWEELKQAVDYCHQQGARFYLTCNTLPMNREADALPEFIRHAERCGVDALIVADLGVLMLARRVAPGLEIHVSTQAGVVNYLTATELYRLGASRVVLARELSLEDIAVIRDKTPPELEIEVFAHGAMCVSFSGRCLLSHYFTARDGNRGECAQPCRWGYHLMEEKRPGRYFPVYEDERGTYILKAEDLLLLPHLDKLAGVGVSSLKIEGRAKAEYYVAVVINAYRIALEQMGAQGADYRMPEWLMEEVEKVSHRPYSSGFLLDGTPPGQSIEKNYVREWDVVAVVDGWEDGALLCTERNRFAVGEEVEVLAPGERPVAMVVPMLYDLEAGEEIRVARHPMMRLRMPCARAFPAGTVIRRSREAALEEM